MTSVNCISFQLMQSLPHRRPPDWSGMIYPWWSHAAYLGSPLCLACALILLPGGSVPSSSQLQRWASPVPWVLLKSLKEALYVLAVAFSIVLEETFLNDCFCIACLFHCLLFVFFVCLVGWFFTWLVVFVEFTSLVSLPIISSYVQNTPLIYLFANDSSTLPFLHL